MLDNVLASKNELLTFWAYETASSYCCMALAY